MLEDNKESLIDDSIKSFEKVPFPTRTDVTEDELDSIFDNGKEKVAEQIRNELRNVSFTAIEDGQDIMSQTQEAEKDK